MFESMFSEKEIEDSINRIKNDKSYYTVCLDFEVTSRGEREADNSEIIGKLNRQFA